MFFSHGSNHSTGALVLLSPNLKFKVEKVLLDNDGRKGVTYYSTENYER